jgi:hypothetical protein
MVARSVGLSGANSGASAARQPDRSTPRISYLMAISEMATHDRQIGKCVLPHVLLNDAINGPTLPDVVEAGRLVDEVVDRFIGQRLEEGGSGLADVRLAGQQCASGHSIMVDPTHVRQHGRWVTVPDATSTADRRIPQHAEVMPPSWNTLYEISRLDEKEFYDALAACRRHPQIDRSAEGK